MSKITLNKTQQKKWYHNMLVFLAPVGVVYLLQVVGLFSLENHTLSLNDFIPTSFTQGAMVLYLANSALDYLRKLQVSK